MTVNEFANELLNLKSELQDKEIRIETKNGILMEPKTVFRLKDENFPVEITKDNVNFVVIIGD